MNKCITTVALLMLTSALSSHAVEVTQVWNTTEDIQDRIDNALPGAEVFVEAGLYRGTLTIKDGITLVGAGDAVTTIDGDGAPEVILFGKESALIGFTIRGGEVLAANRGNFIGIFECTFEDFARIGIYFEGGSGVVAQNILRGNGQSTAILSISANPLIINNLIENNAIGFQWHHHMIPTLLGNLFLNNRVAVGGSSSSSIVMRGNLFDGNAVATAFGPLPPGNEIKSVDIGEFVLQRGRPIRGYRDLMDTTYVEVIKDHPIIVYDLPQQAGSFSAITLFPWATFTVAASAIDTRIASFEAYDWVADRALNAVYQQDDANRPSVRVFNPELLEKMRERYVLENIYIHPASYYDDENGLRIFRRVTNVAQIEVMIPRGYRVVSSKPEALVLGDQNRTWLSIHDLGFTDLEVILEKVVTP